MKFVAWLLTNAVALSVAAWMLDGISFKGADWEAKLVPVALVSLILTIVTMFVAPVVKFLSFPFIILTIGLFLLVINAAMLLLTAWIADKADVGFHVDGFWNAFFGALIITLVGSLINAVILEDD
ncbi:phage holin family protein [Nocardioides sp. JQ2195]|uniref:phage holin family protein n=1 Tax=Nocardioides sp. JQ2195 TaxID=2592334 RepID=UPI00143E649F|nr:phage holin family protein [Nocardioides sp. JQ2195]QIX25295.1 phage holin family protein [Nocardioides sp. JQ2195]